MIIKGRSRTDAAQLAAYLQRQDINERVDVLAIHETAGDDLDAALREMEAIAQLGSNCEKPLYHAQINPEEQLTPEQWVQAIERLEGELQLEGHQRAVVMHVKNGREHCHVVWNRVDSEHMRTVEMNWNYAKHEAVSRELEREFGHRQIAGAHTGREAGQDRPVAKFNHAEQQQAERTGLDPADRKKAITELWQGSDDGRSFSAGLERAGYELARGKRGYVVIDHAGEIHSLTRQIEGARKKDVATRLGNQIPLERLPDAESLAGPRRDHWRVQQERARQEAGHIPATGREDHDTRIMKIRAGLDQTRLQIDYRYQEQEIPESEIKAIAAKQAEAEKKWWDRLKIGKKHTGLSTAGPSLGMRLCEDLEKRRKRLQGMVRDVFAKIMDQVRRGDDKRLPDRDNDDNKSGGATASGPQPFDFDAAEKRRAKERGERSPPEQNKEPQPFDFDAAEKRRAKEYEERKKENTKDKERRQSEKDQQRSDKDRDDREH